MKKELSSYCEQDKMVTIWDLGTMNIIEMNVEFEVEMYKCRTCGLYSTLNYLKKMSKNAKAKT
jgi:hypothetical protein